MAVCKIKSHLYNIFCLSLCVRQDLQHQQVFAFLPLRSYGFRFIVQGDFDLPSSREDVNSDSPWNQWLREEIPFLFIETMETNMKVAWFTVLQTTFILQAVGFGSKDLARVLALIDTPP